MDRILHSESRQRWAIFGLVFSLALAWALATNHVWEDYYITYRSSQHLATGQGLVFNVGDRLHTFTSPLGVLLPAAACRLTGTTSDAAAIWIFRLWSAAALAGAIALIFTLARRLAYGWFAALAVVSWAALDAKSIDFTINGMETGFLLLFIAYTLWALLVCRSRRWVHLGLAWAALMWTRPDSFLYIGLLAAGVWLFNDPAVTGLQRREWLKVFLLAGLTCTALYLPWFIWAWWYYGTPVPHTITAKGGVVTEVKTLAGLLGTLVRFPVSVWRGETSLEATFLASYFQIGGWPVWLVTAARGLGLLVAAVWLVPGTRMETRVASFAFCGLHGYLSYFPFFPFPWYLPGPALLAAVALGGLVAQARAGAGGTGWRLGAARAVVALVIGGLAVEGWQTWQMMRQMAVEQELSAGAVRKQTGLWLKEHAQPGDTVFMEPLGHIGYFSGMKTYDFPGLSSRETVRAIRAVGVNWGYLAEYLSPDWLVLRPWEIIRMRQAIPRLFDETYAVAVEFNTLAAVRQRSVYGRNYIEHDAHWTVFHRQLPKRFHVDVTDPAVRAHYPLPGEAFDGLLQRKLHANGLMSFKVPAGARHLRLAYGLPPGTYQGTPVTDGAGFEVRLFDGRVSRTLLNRYLNPAAVPADRGLKVLEIGLPEAGAAEWEIIVTSHSGQTDVMDWCCWSVPEFSR